MTRNIGTKVYMAPEVMRGKPYNLGCDVYSFALVLWEICTLAKPYAEIAPGGSGGGSTGHVDALSHAVCVQKQRPSLQDVDSVVLRELMEYAWHDDLCQRWDMRQVQKVLQSECDAQSESV